MRLLARVIGTLAAAIAPPGDISDSLLRLVTAQQSFTDAERAAAVAAPGRAAACVDALAAGADREDMCGPASASDGACDATAVSAVLPTTRGRSAAAARALVSVLAAFRELCTSEVVIVDDGSLDVGDHVAEVLVRAHKRWPRTHAFRVPSGGDGVGYARAVEAGVAAASGPLLLLLNDDVVLLPSTATMLLATLHSRPHAAAVTPRIVGLDGRLQEAGGAVFSDGTPVQFSDRWGSQNSLFQFTRPVDYASAACLLVRASPFGFDPAFRPAYFEDTDLAFRFLHGANATVEYAPYALAIHEGSATYAASEAVAAAKRRHLARHRERFAAKWARALTCHYDPALQWGAAPERATLPATRLSRLRVLVIEARAPCVERDSGSVRRFNILRLLLARRYHVTLATEEAPDADGACSLRLAFVGVRIVATADLVLRSLGENCDFDAVLVARRGAAVRWLPLLRGGCPGAALVFDTVDLHFMREFRALASDAGVPYDPQAPLRAHVAALEALMPAIARGPAFAAWARRAAAEWRAMNESDTTLVVSDAERDEIGALQARGAVQADAAVVVVSNVIEAPASAAPAFGARSGALFVGNWEHPPNADAVRWLADAVLPLPALAGLPDDFTLHLAGAGAPPPWLATLVSAGRFRVVNHGALDAARLEGLYASVRVALAPLRYGAGVKGKVNAAMARGVPLVATPAAIEGMRVRAGVDALVAGNAPAFAVALATLHGDEGLWRRVAAAACANVAAHFSMAAGAQSIGVLFDGVLTPHLPPRRDDVFTSDPCDRAGRFGAAAAAAPWRVAEGIANVTLVALQTPPDVVLEAAAPLGAEIRLRRVTTAAAVAACTAYRDCVGLCRHSGSSNAALYLGGVSGARARPAAEDPRWTCHRAATPPPGLAPVPAAVSFRRVAGGASETFRGPEARRAWKISAEVARHSCRADAACGGFCHDPRRHSLFFAWPLAPRGLAPRGKRG
eukprot:CAMPEP_0119277510 /NCGR_PEP_ID=MMETSP1329-20130426/17285_1 /TAXON_ID=114041 /ORGANISM="Genus nov. species nov., Strain RCC1024" /LENGTH=968 /DNA_ID=CAMNT_0007277983 /DNA_START=381 /DNA_END=3283 /DNA_ORIENTATION=-